MKRVLSVIAIAVVLLVSPVSVSAHPGDTDLNGGHYDWETRDYHYHHGHPAHYHTDGVCPYGDYDQYTDVGSETRYDRINELASLLEEDGYETTAPEQPEKSNNNTKEKSNPTHGKLSYMTAAVAAVSALFLVSIISIILSWREKRRFKKKQKELMSHSYYFYNEIYPDDHKKM